MTCGCKKRREWIARKTRQASERAKQWWASRDRTATVEPGRDGGKAGDVIRILADRVSAMEATQDDVEPEAANYLSGKPKL